MAEEHTTAVVQRYLPAGARLLSMRYPRLTWTSVNLRTDEMFRAVVERQFFALACRQIRWERNDMAHRLDE
jgi:hypothetical protein